MKHGKILLINWRDIRNPEAGGAEIYYHEIFKRLCARYGYQVKVLAHAYRGSPDQEIFDGMRIVRIGTRNLFNYAVISWVRRHAAEYDLVIEDINKIAFFTPLYCKRPRIHLVMHLFGMSIFNEVPWPAALYVYGFEKLIRYMYRHERFVTISKSTQDEITAITSNSSLVHLVEPGIDTDFYSPGSKAAPPFMLSVGRLKKYKNLSFLVGCFERLQRLFPDLTFKIAGDGDFAPHLAMLLKRRGIERSVQLLGRVSEEEKRELMRGATLFVNASPKEGWGITNIEAALCGTVSLSSRVPGLQDSVVHGETGFLYEYNNERDFLDKASQLLSDAALRHSMEKEAVGFARGFSWERMSERMYAVLKELS